MSSLLNVPFNTIISSDDSQIAFDSVTNEQHNASATVTEHPVEDGADIADHIQQDLDALQLQGIVSDHPILINVEAGPDPSVPGTDPRQRAKAAYNEFLRLKNAGALLTVTTELRTYEDLAITGIAVVKDKDKRHILDIGLTLTPIRKATVQLVDAPRPRNPVHKDRRKGGRKPKKSPKTAVEEKADLSLTNAANALEKLRGAGGIF